MQMEEDTEDICEACERDVHPSDLLDVNGQHICIDCWTDNKMKFSDKIMELMKGLDDWEIEALFEAVEDIENDR